MAATQQVLPRYLIADWFRKSEIVFFPRQNLAIRVTKLQVHGLTRAPRPTPRLI